jgi:hypothetical protein
MQWYEREKDHLTANGGYWYNEMVFPLEDYEKYPEFYEELPKGFKRELLFKEKP